MAVLNKIRQQKIILIAIIALALIAFVVSVPDILSMTDENGAKQTYIGSVNDIDIKREDFLQKVDIAQRQAGPNSTNTQVMNRVWNQEVDKAVMQTQFNALGLSVERDQMKDLLKKSLASSPEFLNEAGLFDEAKLNEYIANLKETSPEGFRSWVNYEHSVAANALKQNYFNLVKAGLTGTLTEGELQHKLEGDKVDIKFVQVPYTSIADSLVDVTKSDISNYINAHKKQYEVEASTDIKFVEFKEIASVEDENDIKTGLHAYLNGKEAGRNDAIEAFSKVKNDEEYINIIAGSAIKFDSRFVFKSTLPTIAADTLYNSNAGDVYGPYKDGDYYKLSKIVAVKQIPDSAKVRHILIPFLGARSAKPEVTQTEAQAKVTADSLLTIIKSDRSKFPELVKAFSSDQGSVEKEGRYDWHPYNTMVPEFNDFEFDGKVGDLGVVKTIFGFHIIEIEGQKDKKKAVQVGTIARKIEPSEETINKVFRDASNFEVSSGNKDFETVATESKFKIRPVNGIKALDENIPGVGNQRQIVRWSFEEETEVGDVKRFNISNGYVIAQLVAKHKEGLKSVGEATATVMPIIRKEKKAKMIRDRVSATSLQDLATAEKVTVRSASAITMKTPTISGAGREPLVVGSAFGLSEGETSKLIDGEKGVYMLEVTKVTPAVKLDNYQAAANRIEQQKTSAVNSKLVNALKEAADIEDNRAKSQVQ